MKKASLLLIGIIVVSGCHSPRVVTPVAPSTPNHWELRPFNSLVIKGQAQVELVNGPYGITIAGIPSNYHTPPYHLANQCLSLKSDIKLPAPPVITISTPALKQLIVTDSAQVRAKNFKANNLTVIAKNYGTISLEGHFKIHKILQEGYGRIDIYWLKSQALLIEAHTPGPIYLAGQVTNMTVNLTKDAILHARYLRARNAHIFTTHQATAEIMAVDTLKAFAANRSNIYYYHQPKNLTAVTKDASNVLYLPKVKS